MTAGPFWEKINSSGNAEYEYACHEGNYGMVNLLTGGRADEDLALRASALVSRQRMEGGHPGMREPVVPFHREPER